MFQQLSAFVTAHQFTIGMTTLWILAAAFHALPPPLPTERWYGAFFNFAQVVGANLSKIGQQKPPA